MHKLAVCVPYRNREAHMEKFIPHMTEILKKQDIDFQFYIAHQKDDKPFNRGKLLNIAYTEALKDGCDYFTFHDIDLLPMDGHADYSYPADNPVHISTEIDEWDFKPPYKENFGGCVIFTKEQFEKINGFANDYWGWGAEDDDLFWRAKSKNLIETIRTPYDFGTRIVARFNGESSFIKIPFEQKYDGVESGNYTISLLIKSECLKMMDPVIYGDENAAYAITPIVNRHCFDLISYCNTQDFKGVVWDDKNVPHDSWAKTKYGDWLHLTVVFNRNEKKTSIYINGTLTGEGVAPDTIRKYYGTPFFIGKSDASKWYTHKNSFFLGAIGEITLWDKALNADELTAMYAQKEYKPLDNRLILHYDFSNCEESKVLDKSGNGHHAELHNIDLVDEEIGALIIEEGPYRRRNRYNALAHEKQGVVNGTMVQSENSRKNTLRLYDLMTVGIDEFTKTGLSTLEYTLEEKRENMPKTWMMDLTI